MSISKETYKKAKETILQYEREQRELVRDLIPSIRKRLEKYFENTFIEKFRVEQDWEEENSVNITSEEPTFDEDYGGEFDEDMEALSKEFGITIRFESGNYGK